MSTKTDIKDLLLAALKDNPGSLLHSSVTIDGVSYSFRSLTDILSAIEELEITAGDTPFRQPVKAKLKF